MVPRDFDVIEVPFRERGEPQLFEPQGAQGAGGARCSCIPGRLIFPFCARDGAITGPGPEGGGDGSTRGCTNGFRGDRVCAGRHAGGHAIAAGYESYSSWHVVSAPRGIEVLPATAPGTVGEPHRHHNHVRESGLS